MNKKVTKKSAPKKVAKKVVKKPATKKAKSIKTVQAIRDGFKKPSKHNPLPYLRYLNTSISDVSMRSFRKWFKSLPVPQSLVSCSGVSM